MDFDFDPNNYDTVFSRPHDDALLEALMAYPLAEFLDFDATFPTSSSDDEGRRALEVRRDKDAAKSRVYRRRQKGLREELRRQETELTKQLARLQQAKQSERGDIDTYRSPSYCLWRELALRLRAERTLAEAQQKQLNVAVRAQELYIAHLYEVLPKRLGSSIECSQDVVGEYSPKRQQPQDMDADLSATYMRIQEGKNDTIRSVAL